MKIWIVERNKKRTELIRKTLYLYGKIIGIECLIRTFSKPEMAWRRLCSKKEKPDVLFVNPDAYDVTYSGLSLAEEFFSHNIDSSLVLLSDTVEYAYSGYQYHAEGYILYTDDLKKQIAHTLHRIHYRYIAEISTLNFKEKRENISVPVSEIIFMESEAHYVNIHTVTKTYRTYGSLTALYQQVQERIILIPVGKSYVINPLFAKWHTREGIAMKNNINIPIPVRLSSKICKILSECFVPLQK